MDAATANRPHRIQFSFRDANLWQTAGRRGIFAAANLGFDGDEVLSRMPSDLGRIGQASAPALVFAGPDDRLLTDYADYFLGAGFAVSLVGSGLDCLDAIRRSAPCVLVLDLDPGLIWGSADDVLALLTEDADVPSVHIVVLSSSAEIRAKKWWPIRQPTVLSKPVAPAALALAVDACCTAIDQTTADQSPDGYRWHP